MKGLEDLMDALRESKFAVPIRTKSGEKYVEVNYHQLLDYLYANNLGAYVSWHGIIIHQLPEERYIS
jgi:hypothetical protein